MRFKINQNYEEAFDLKIRNRRDFYDIDLSDYVVTIKEEKSYCVGRVEMVNSNKIDAVIGPEKSARYHQLFSNSMSYVLEHFGGQTIKNVGGSLLFYFPESTKAYRRLDLSCIECGMAMIQIHEEMGKNAARQGLPKIDYNVSADYGRVTIIDISGTKRIDLLGSPMDTCSKISYKSLPNKFVIAKGLYDIVKDFDEYNFREYKNPNKSKHDNFAYIVTRNQNNRGEI